MADWVWTGDDMESSRLEKRLSAAVSWPCKRAHDQGLGRIGLGMG